MKFKRAILAFLAAIFMFGLTACSKNLGNVNTKIKSTARRDKITLVVEFNDEESRIFSSITPTAYLYDFDNDKRGDEVESKTLQNAGDINNVGKETKSKEVVFDNLEKSTDEKTKKYQILVKATVNGYSYELANKVVAMSDEGTKENPKEIKTAEDFLDIQYDREGYFKLMNDIDFAPLAKENEIYKLTPMFTTESNSFKGEIDGNNKTIKNFSIESNNQYNGLVGYLVGEIKNLNVENAEIHTARTSEVNTGLLVGYNAGKVIGCKVTNGKVEVQSTAYSLTYPLIVGGLVGTVAGDNSDIAVKDCEAFNLTVKVEAVHRATVGGMIGRVIEPKTIRMGQEITNNKITGLNLTVKQENKTSTKDDILIYVGGFVGATARTISDSEVIETENYKTTITVTTKKSTSAIYKDGLKVYDVFVGGFAGLTVDNSKGASIKNVKFNGSISVMPGDFTAENNANQEAYTMYVGGLVGAMNGIVIENSTAEINEFKAKFHQTEKEDAEKPEEKATYKGAYGLIIGYTTNLDVKGNTSEITTLDLAGEYTETKLNSQNK